jgi:basic membrane protein A
MLKNKRLWNLLALATIVALLATACQPAATPTPTPVPPTPKPATPTPPPEKLKAAFVYVAAIGDLGWTWAQEQGRLMVEEELGDKVETAYIENVPEGPDAERVIRDFATKGYDIVFATSFGFMDQMFTVAEEFPDQYFEHCSGYKTADNMATYFGRMYQPRFLSGLVAGKATSANKIGYVAAFSIPEVIRGINAFTLGVRTANPEATVHVVWTNTWYDPVLEKEAAVALLDEGCDVIAQHQDTTEPQKAAQEQGAVSIGYDSDMRQFVGDTVLTSPVWNWGPYYIRRIEALMAGTWTTGQYWGGMKDGIVDLAPLSPQVPDDVKALVEEWKQKILSGEWDVFNGPIKGQGGVLSIPEGVTMTDEEMLAMDWFVDGVVGEAPAEPPEVAGPAIPVEKPKVAFVYVGPVGDLGWSYAHDQGRLYLEQELGVETAYSELVAEGPDSTRVIRDYAEKGYDVVFATSFGYMDSVIEVAAEYPDVIFEHCTGYETTENVGIYDGRGYQAWYLAGIAAGKVTENNKLGYVAPYPIPEVVRNMNAFTLGARSVNPEAEVHPVWIYTWVDPVTEREAAQALLDLGCDVIARESDSTEPDKLAEENGVYAVGYNAYVPDVAPNSLLTAPIWHWGIFYKKAVQAVMDGTWTSTPVWWGLAEGLLDLAPFGPAVPDDAKALIEQKKQEIISGTFDVFVGPIKDNTGELRVPDGTTMTDEEKLAFDWLVEGAVGTIPE